MIQAPPSPRNHYDGQGPARVSPSWEKNLRHALPVEQKGLGHADNGQEGRAAVPAPRTDVW